MGESGEVMVTRLNCLRCGHAWWPRVIGGATCLPKGCPRCRTTLWNTPRKNKMKLKYRSRREIKE